MSYLTEERNIFLANRDPKYLEKAIKLYQEALRVYNPKDNPLDYGTIKNNIGIVYRILAKVKDKKNNSGKAIEAFE